MERNLFKCGEIHIKKLGSSQSAYSSSSEFTDFENEEEYELEYEEEWPNVAQAVIDQIYKDLLPLIVNPLVMLSSEEDMARYPNEKVSFKNGNLYEGEILESRFHGEGTFYWADGAQYKGNFYRNYAKGYGTYTNTDGDNYNGCFNEGVSSHGVSVLTTNNFTYTGSFLNGYFYGKGLLQALPLYFDGDFVNGLPSIGIRRYETGLFVGEFDKEGCRKYGKFLFNNNDLYSGHWYNDKFNDFGVYQWSNVFPYSENPLITYKETYYSGFWINGERNGIGLLRFDDILIIHRWKLDKKDGSGLIRAANGQIYVSNNLFKANKYYQGWELILNDDTKKIVCDIIDFPNKFDGRNSCFLTPHMLQDYIQCKDILKKKIILLMFHIDEKCECTPYFISNYEIGKHIAFLDFMDTVSKSIDYITLERELKCLRQVIQDNFHIIKLMYIKYAYFDRDIKLENLTSTGHICMNRLGLWLFYNDVFANFPRINKMDNIILCDKIYHLLPKNPLDSKDPIYVWEFIRHLIHIIVILNKTNPIFFEQALFEKETIFGLFATMFLIFLREFSIIHDKKESLSWKLVSDCPKLIQSLLLQIQNIKYELNIREAYKFFHNIKSVRGKFNKYNLENVTDENFIECASNIFPNMSKYGILLDTCFNITPLELCEIIFLCFEKEILNRNLLQQSE